MGVLHGFEVLGLGEALLRLRGRCVHGAPSVQHFVDRSAPTYGIMYGMRRTTIYLTDSLKAQLARAAQEEGRSEADLIREGLEQLLRNREPEPRLPLFNSGHGDIAERVDELLEGFGSW